MQSKPTASFINSIESWVDNKFKLTRLPHQIQDVAIWHLLTVSEDLTRMLFTRIVEKQGREIEATVDRIKYSLKFCLQKIAKESTIKSSFPTPQKTIPDAYVAANHLIDAGLEYSVMVRIFTSLHGRHSRVEASGRNISISYKCGYDSRYAALEILNHGKEPAFDITTFVYNNLSGISPHKTLIEALTNGIRIRLGRVVYDYQSNVVFEIVNGIEQREIIIPNDFSFEWGTGHQTHALINSLLVRCIYHILSVNCAVQKFKIRGGFESSLVLQTTKEKLINDLRVLSDFPRESVSKFLDTLTYGCNTSSPDPALQPIVALKNGVLLIPCMHTITNNIQRNILTLTARTQPDIFNRQSDIFESQMCADLMSAAKNWPKKASNSIFRYSETEEEIDIIVVDESCQCALVMEARWMLRPGDPREVHNRIDACGEKVSQLSRKLEFVERNLKKILRGYFGIPKLNGAWKIFGAVVVDGFGGRLSSDPKIPIISMDVLKTGLESFLDIFSLGAWIRSLKWLPQIDMHFTEHTNELNTPFGSMQVPVILIVDKQPPYCEYVKSSTKATKGVIE